MSCLIKKIARANFLASAICHPHREQTMSQTKVALVTGANRGIGLAIAKGLAKQNYHVLMGCRDINAAEKLVDKTDDKITPVTLDLSDADAIATCLNDIDQQYPKIDVLVNNAGVLDREELDQLSPEQLQQSMQVNALAPFALMQFFAPRMAKNRFGRIVNVSSGWGATSGMLEGPVAYAISKSSLNVMTQIVAKQYRKYLKVNAMCPGWVRTRMGGMTATRSPEKGAETAIWLAGLSNDGPTGEFFRDEKQIAW